MKKIIFLLVGICVLRFGICEAEASFDFPAQYDVSYTYSETGSTQVHQRVVLTNRLSQTYPTTYQLTIAGAPPQNVTARDNRGPLKYKVLEQTQDQTVIEFTFNVVVVGKGKSLGFDVNYELPKAKLIGDTYEIILPQTKSLDKADKYTLHLYVPTSFGPPLSLIPHPTLVPNSSNPALAHFVYTKSNLEHQESVAVFGLHQLPPTIKVLPPIQFFPPFVTRLRVQITNPNSTSLSPRTITLSSTNFPLSIQSLITPQLAPDQQVVLTIPADPWHIPDFEPKTITFKIDRDEVIYNVPDTLFLAWYASIVIFIISAFVISSHFTHQAGSLHLQKRKK